VGLLKAKLYIITDKKYFTTLERKKGKVMLKKRTIALSFKALINVLQHMF